eukprot:2561444-Prymnesium_polylepis.1
MHTCGRCSEAPPVNVLHSGVNPSHAVSQSSFRCTPEATHKRTTQIRTRTVSDSRSDALRATRRRMKTEPPTLPAPAHSTLNGWTTESSGCRCPPAPSRRAGSSRAIARRVSRTCQPQLGPLDKRPKQTRSTTGGGTRGWG